MAISMNRRSFVRGGIALGIAGALTPALALAAEATSSAKADGEAASSSTKDAGSSSAAGELQIFAANSLEKAMPEVQELYSESHPGVTFADTQFKASGDLVEQMQCRRHGRRPHHRLQGHDGRRRGRPSSSTPTPRERHVRQRPRDHPRRGLRHRGRAPSRTSPSAGIGKIAIGDAATVPAGKYANQALASVGLYTGDGGRRRRVCSRASPTRSHLADKVGTAAAYVSTGDCVAGFVYSSSDIYRYDGVEERLRLPRADSHKPIVYPGAVTADAANAEIAVDFLTFCMTDPQALQVWSQYGFEVSDE